MLWCRCRSVAYSYHQLYFCSATTDTTTSSTTRCYRRRRSSTPTTPCPTGRSSSSAFPRASTSSSPTSWPWRSSRGFTQVRPIKTQNIQLSPALFWLRLYVVLTTMTILKKLYNFQLRAIIWRCPLTCRQHQGLNPWQLHVSERPPQALTDPM